MTDSKWVKVDVKQPVLSSSLSRFAAAPVAQSGRKSDDKKDDDKSLSTSSPSSLSSKANVYNPASENCPDLSDEIKRSALAAFADEVANRRAGVSVSDRTSLSRKCVQYFINSGDGSGVAKWWYVAQSAIAASPTTSTPNVISLLNCAEGSDFNQRLGRQIHAKQLRLFLTLSPNLVTTPGEQLILPIPTVRVIVFRDRFPIIGQPVVAEDVFPPVDYKSVLNSVGATSSGPSTTNGWMLAQAPFNVNTHGTRYHIYHDEVISPANVGTAIATSTAATTTYATPYYVKIMEIKADLDFKQVYYGTSQNQLLENALYLMVIADYGEGTAQQIVEWYYHGYFTTDYVDC